jgi:predicted small secreted protein
MRMKIIALAVGAAALTGCATMTDYSLYAETQQIIAQEQARAEIARFEALREIAKTGDPTAQVAAVITLNQNQNSNSNRAQGLQAPTNLNDTLLRWASIIVPSAVSVYGIGKNAEVAINNSNNARDISLDTNNTMLGFGELIAAPTRPIVGGEDDVLLFPK